MQNTPLCSIPKSLQPHHPATTTAMTFLFRSHSQLTHIEVPFGYLFEFQLFHAYRSKHEINRIEVMSRDDQYFLASPVMDTYGRGPKKPRLSGHLSSSYG